MRTLLVLLATACTTSPHPARSTPTPIVAPSPGQPPTPIVAPSPQAPTPIACQLTKPSPTPELSWMKQPVADWLRSHDPAVVPPHCKDPFVTADPAFDAWYAGAIRRLTRIPCDELDTRLITYRGAAFGTGARINRRALPPTGSGMNTCYPSEGPSLTFGVDATGAITCVIPVIEDGPSGICLG